MRRYELIVLLIASAIFLTGILSPPSLMDDVDAVQAQMARNMVQSGDWVTLRLDGVAYLEKAPLKSWLTAVCYLIFGVHDWTARLPVALAAILLAWVVVRFGRWAFSPQAGFYAGLVTATCVGLFLFTRAVMPDVLLTLAVTVALWSFLRALDELLHGVNGAEGWGLQTRPDGTLLYVTGFNPSTNTYSYQVNERFGATYGSATAYRPPFQIGIQARLTIGPDRVRQALDAMRAGGGFAGGMIEAMLLGQGQHGG